MISGMDNIYDVLRVLVNAARVQLGDSVIADCLEVIDSQDSAPAPAAVIVTGDASA
jgi:hypothetical protein